MSDREAANLRSPGWNLDGLSGDSGSPRSTQAAWRGQVNATSSAAPPPAGPEGLRSPRTVLWQR
jgi:hypothetical protein